MGLLRFNPYLENHAESDPKKRGGVTPNLLHKPYHVTGPAFLGDGRRNKGQPGLRELSRK